MTYYVGPPSPMPNPRPVQTCSLWGHPWPSTPRPVNSCSLCLQLKGLLLVSEYGGGMTTSVPWYYWERTRRHQSGMRRNQQGTLSIWNDTQWTSDVINLCSNETEPIYLKHCSISFNKDKSNVFFLFWICDDCDMCSVSNFIKLPFPCRRHCRQEVGIFCDMRE